MHVRAHAMGACCQHGLSDQSLEASLVDTVTGAAQARLSTRRHLAVGCVLHGCMAASDSDARGGRDHLTGLTAAIAKLVEHDAGAATGTAGKAAA